MAFAGKVLLLLLGAVPLVCWGAVAGLDWWVTHKRYLTNTDTIADIARSASLCCNGDVEGMVANVTAALQARYGESVIVPDRWIMMRAGGWMGAFKLMYASLTGEGPSVCRTLADLCCCIAGVVETRPALHDESPNPAASPRAEYILIFGTGIDTSGHSGRYWASIS
jgi:sigma non-opioid intracellular receptor